MPGLCRLLEAPPRREVLPGRKLCPRGRWQSYVLLPGQVRQPLHARGRQADLFLLAKAITLRRLRSRPPLSPRMLSVRKRIAWSFRLQSMPNGKSQTLRITFRLGRLLWTDRSSSRNIQNLFIPLPIALTLESLRSYNLLPLLIIHPYLHILTGPFSHGVARCAIGTHLLPRSTLARWGTGGV